MSHKLLALFSRIKMTSTCRLVIVVLVSSSLMSLVLTQGDHPFPLDPSRPTPVSSPPDDDNSVMAVSFSSSPDELSVNY
jgi:hypothetical protein